MPPNYLDAFELPILDNGLNVACWCIVVAQKRCQARRLYPFVGLFVFCFCSPCDAVSLVQKNKNQSKGNCCKQCGKAKREERAVVTSHHHHLKETCFYWHTCAACVACIKQWIQVWCCNSEEFLFGVNEPIKLSWQKL